MQRRDFIFDSKLPNFFKEDDDIKCRDQLKVIWKNRIDITNLEKYIRTVLLILSSEKIKVDVRKRQRSKFKKL